MAIIDKLYGTSLSGTGGSVSGDFLPLTGGTVNGIFSAHTDGGYSIGNRYPILVGSISGTGVHIDNVNGVSGTTLHSGLSHNPSGEIVASSLYQSPSNVFSVWASSAKTGFDYNNLGTTSIEAYATATDLNLKYLEGSGSFISNTLLLSRTGITTTGYGIRSGETNFNMTNSAGTSLFMIENDGSARMGYDKSGYLSISNSLLANAIGANIIGAALVITGTSYGQQYHAFTGPNYVKGLSPVSVSTLFWDLGIDMVSGQYANSGETYLQVLNIGSGNLRQEVGVLSSGTKILYQNAASEIHTLETNSSGILITTKDSLAVTDGLKIQDSGTTSIVEVKNSGTIDTAGLFRRIGNTVASFGFSSDNYFRINSDNIAMIDVFAGSTIAVNPLSSSSITSFYVNSSGPKRALHVDTNNVLVGIGTQVPTSTLHVSGTTNLDGQVVISALTQNDALTQILVREAGGEVKYRDSSTLAVPSATYQTLTYASAGSVTWLITSGYNSQVTMTADTYLSVSGLTDGDTGIIIVAQDSTGGWSLSFSGNQHALVNGGGNPIVTSNASAQDILSFTYNGTNLYWNAGYNYRTPGGATPSPIL